MYRVIKTFQFCAAHVLPKDVYSKKCAHLHGHNYTVEVELQASTLDHNMMVLDFGRISEVKAMLDHTYLNEVHINLRRVPTAEGIALFIMEQVSSRIPSDTNAKVTRVRVSETDGNVAEWLGEFDV